MEKYRLSHIYILTALILAIFIFSLLPFFYASLFCHPVLDDYGYSLNVNKAILSGGGLFQILKNACRTVAENYFNWQGTFSAVFLFTLQPAVFSQDMYFVTTIVMISSLSLATFFLIDTVLVLCFKAERVYSILISSSVLFCTFQFLVNVHQALFWWNGSVFYTFFHALALCFFSFLIRMYVYKRGTRHKICFGFSLLLVFLIGGGNYSTALFSVCLTILALFILTRMRAYKVWQFYLVFFVLLFSFLISIFAPGNSVRATFFDGYNPLEAIVASIYYSFYYIGEWTRLPQVLLFIFLSPFLYSIAQSIDFEYKYPLFVLLLSFLCFATELTPPLYAMRSLGSGRQVNVYYYTYYLLMIFNIFYISGWFAKRKIIKVDISVLFKTKIIVPICIVLILLFVSSCGIGLSNLRSVNVFNVIKSGEAWQYDQEYESLVNRIKNGESTVSDVRTCPEDIYCRIGLDEEWVVDAVASYYGVEPFSVITPGSSS